ncbi:hypothetical protein COW36_00620 [bacterium (Candidatus Blackallbacteria) CG17_big_fil_post_rev_8_21_14_2_50_48_46]|uniref:Uncharacterized protein n=1 Tax=bacterium (Candidatus Blackallbacteria) CG17_big_fil_post_rev_8_21_14_2_50_48_46 TaxID=2014261 RepID=A0A2M7GB17_9BACT|nr:MAG: hypothetical protein COW36_00620 [bacterium (Candidatus Blackallbacteria) CG17_big_fil_post_rev_8_21_14_2_50_48_46]PIW49021.1 MAG: hypothetical protein COW20_07835 [bacterium (Candidatus Blackallbacteria) CG13_big_fil_rev_8_21_14_2_50_49_14]
MSSMGSSVGQVSQTGPIHEEQPPSVETSEAQGQAPLAHDNTESKRKTGVISSTIYPAQRQGNQEQAPENQTASKTNQLNQTKTAGPKQSKKLTPLDKAKRQEEKIDNLAERITNVLKQISEFKTGMLDSNLAPSQRLQWVTEKYPGFSKIFGVLLTQLEPVILLMQRINQKLLEKNLIQGKRRLSHNAHDRVEQDSADHPPPPPPKVSFLELAEKNIVFCDNRKRPLYSIETMRGKHGYTASEEVLVPMIMENIIQAFQEVAPKAKAIPTPQSGFYAGKAMDQVMYNISEEEIMLFLNYVQKFPRGYVGKNFRITESFAGWVVSGTPDD